MQNAEHVKFKVLIRNNMDPQLQSVAVVKALTMVYGENTAFVVIVKKPDVEKNVEIFSNIADDGDTVKLLEACISQIQRIDPELITVRDKKNNE